MVDVRKKVEHDRVRIPDRHEVKLPALRTEGRAVRAARFRTTHVDQDVCYVAVTGDFAPANAGVGVDRVFGVFEPVVLGEPKRDASQAVAAHLRPRTVGILHDHRRSRPGVLSRRDDENAVGADTEMAIAQSLDRIRREGSLGIENDEVVPQTFVLFELEGHGAAPPHLTSVAPRRQLGSVHAPLRARHRRLPVAVLKALGMLRPLLLTGFMGTGKSTVGKLIAEWCGRPHVDLDAEIERTTGQTVSDIFATKGEREFRAFERAALARVLASNERPVVSLGGGTLLDRPARLEALDQSVVVTLEASVDDVLRRTSGSRARPLLDAPVPRVRAEELLEQRKTAYSESHGRVGTSGRSPEDVARDVLAIWRRDPLAVAAGNRSYCVEVGRRFAAERLPALLGGASLGLLVTDRNVQSHHADGIENGMEQSGVRTATVVLEPGEEHKNTASIERIWNAALAAGADRKSRFLALGGGVVTDVAGFAAATWMRGVAWLGIPTTLLAMVDASVGGKTAIDLKTAKNAVGAFWQPSAVLCDVDFLGTEPARGFASALAEVVKTAIIGDPELFAMVEQRADEIRARDPDIVVELVRRSVRVKARVVGLDEREDGLRACLNLGHTVGHALEAHGGYGRLRHGEAVSLGLVAALRIGERLGLTDRSLVERCILVLRVLGLPVELGSQPLAKAVDLLGHDKKRAGAQVRFVVARSLGRVELLDLALDDLKGHALALAG